MTYALVAVLAFIVGAIIENRRLSRHIARLQRARYRAGSAAEQAMRQALGGRS